MFECRKCDCEQYELREVPIGTAIGLYCRECGLWHKWVGKNDLVRYKDDCLNITLEDYQKKLDWAELQDWNLIYWVAKYVGGTEYEIDINGVRFAVRDFDDFKDEFFKLIAKHAI